MANVYNSGKLILVDGGLGADGWATVAADIGALLVTTAYAYDADHGFVDAITNELVGGGYARLTALTGRTITKNDGTNRVEFDLSDITFPTLDIAAGQPFAVVLYNETPGTDATRELIAYGVLTSPNIPNGGDYTLNWDAAGGIFLGD